MSKKPKSPPRYPPDEEPKITNEERSKWSDPEYRLRPEEGEKYIEDVVERTARKGQRLVDSDPRDRKDREASLSATMIVAMPKVAQLMKMAVEYSEEQSLRAGQERGFVNRLIETVLRRHPDKTAKEVFNAIGNGEANEDEVLVAKWQDGGKIGIEAFQRRATADDHEEPRRVSETRVTENIVFDKAFEMRVSRCRAALTKVT
jgi:hypothetical protein